MKKTTIRLLVIVVATFLLLNTVSYAAIESSDYLSAYAAYITTSGNTIKVNFDVQGTRIMDKVGATEIYLYEKTTPSGSWSLVQTYLSSDSNYYPSMIGTNTFLKMGYVTYSGSSSYQYKAYVTVYAEKDGGSDSRVIIAS